MSADNLSAEIEIQKRERSFRNGPSEVESMVEGNSKSDKINSSMFHIFPGHLQYRGLNMTKASQPFSCTISPCYLGTPDLANPHFYFVGICLS